MAEEFVRGSDVLGPGAAGGARSGYVERKVQAFYEPGNLRLLLDRVGLLFFQLGF